MKAGQRRTVIQVDERNAPAEQIEATAKQFPWLTSGVCVVPPSLAALVHAAQERELEIIRAKQAAALGAVVLATGGIVPVEEAVQINGRWYSRGGR